MRHTLIFDIETEPLPDDQLRLVAPPFDPAEVATGNLKDPEKIAAKIAEAQASHFDNIKASAALSAATGRVVAIGVLEIKNRDNEIQLGPPDDAPDRVTIWDCTESEKAGLNAFWMQVTTVLQRGGIIVGFNSNGFDLPFLARRSWVSGITDWPQSVLIPDWKWWNKQRVFDLREMWLLGDKGREKSSLNHVARVLGLGQKTGDHGHNFGELWRSKDPAQNAIAEQYLIQDVMMTKQIWERMTYGI